MVPMQSAELLLIVCIVCQNLLVKLYNLLVFLGNPLICCNILIIKWCHDLMKKKGEHKEQYCSFQKL